MMVYKSNFRVFRIYLNKPTSLLLYLLLLQWSERLGSATKPLLINLFLPQLLMHAHLQRARAARALGTRSLGRSYACMHARPHICVYEFYL